MRLLLVFPFVPYPPNDGGRIGFFNPIKYLSRYHEVAVFSLAAPQEEPAANELRKLYPNLHIFRRSSRDWTRLTRGLILTPPGASARYWYPAAGDFLRNTISSYAPDIVEFHHLNTSVYRKYADGVPVILREHNVEYKVWERHAETAGSLVQRLYAKWAAPRVRRYEGERASQFNKCVVVSKADAGHLREVSDTAQIEVIPSGVDTEYFYPRPEIPAEPFRMVLTGSFEWKPKQHNLRVLLAEIMPRIKAKLPQATLYVVGKGVPPDLQQLAERTPGVTVTGPVADVRPYVWGASLILNYLESGGGIALKVLEAMAMRKPVLSNSLGCEGIEVEHGREVYLADGIEQFAEAAALLLQNSTMRNALSEAAYNNVHSTYSWTAIAAQLTRSYEAVLSEPDAKQDLPSSTQRELETPLMSFR